MKGTVTRQADTKSSLFGPRLFGSLAVVEEEYVRFDAVGVEDAGGETEGNPIRGRFQRWYRGEPVPSGNPNYPDWLYEAWV